MSPNILEFVTLIHRLLKNGSFQKRSILPPRRKFLPSGGGGEKKLFPIIVNLLGHPKGVGGLTSYFLRGGGMDVFWNDPMTRHNNSEAI
jgi:hypothetical protein